MMLVKRMSPSPRSSRGAGGWKCFGRAVVMAMTAALWLSGPAGGQSYERESLPHLGGGITSIAAVNASGQIVGFSLDGEFRTKAIKYENGVFQSLGLPGSFNVANGSNDLGHIVGFAIIGEKHAIPFLYDAGAITFLPMLDGEEGIARDINNAGVIVGSSIDAEGVNHPVRWVKVGNNWQISILGTLGGDAGEAIAINAAGTVVGVARNEQGHDRAFVWNSKAGMSELVTLGGPNARATGINSAGVIVGSSQNVSGHLRPCRWINGVPADLGTFGGTTGDASSIDDEGVIVGSARAANNFTYAAIWTNGQIESIDSFTDAGSVAVDLIDRNTIIGGKAGSGSGSVIWTFTGAAYEIVDLGTLGGSTSNAFAVNDLGEVAGVSDIPGQQSRGFFWRDGTMTTINTLGGTASAGLGMNNLSQVVGWSTLANNQRRALLWDNGALTDLGTLGGSESTALAINDQTRIVGHSLTSGGAQHAFVWAAGVMTDLGTLGGIISEATAINNHNVIVGSALNTQSRTIACKWEFVKGAWAITPLTGFESFTFSKALGIDDSGMIVGQYLTQSGQMRAFKWFDDEAFDLGLLTGNFSIARAVRGDHIVGTGSAVAGAIHALGFLDPGIANLNDRLTYTSGWVLVDARAVNTQGWSVGTGTFSGVNRAFLLRPATGPSETEGDILSAQIQFGSIISGNVDSLRQSDDQVLRTRSVFGFTALEPNIMELVIAFDAGVASANELTILIESRINNTSGTSRVRLRNWSTSAFQLIATHTITNTETVEVFSGINPTNFLRASDRRVELSVRHSVIATFTALGFDSFFDHVRQTSN